MGQVTTGHRPELPDFFVRQSTRASQESAHGYFLIEASTSYDCVHADRLIQVDYFDFIDHDTVLVLSGWEGRIIAGVLNHLGYRPHGNQITGVCILPFHTFPRRDDPQPISR